MACSTCAITRLRDLAAGSGTGPTGQGRKGRSASHDCSEWPAGPTGLVAEGGGDAGRPRQPQDGDHQIAQAGHDPRPGRGADLRAVLIEIHVADPVQPAPDAPVAADDDGELGVASLGEGQRGDRVAGLPRPLPLHLAAAGDLDGLGGVREGQPAATAVTLRVRRSARPCPCSRLSQAFGTSRQLMASAGRQWATGPAEHAAREVLAGLPGTSPSAARCAPSPRPPTPASRVTVDRLTP